jgi:hypothetical protein
MMQHFDLRETILSQGDVVIRPCEVRDEKTLVQWIHAHIILEWP